MPELMKVIQRPPRQHGRGMESRSWGGGDKQSCSEVQRSGWESSQGSRAEPWLVQQLHSNVAEQRSQIVPVIYHLKQTWNLKQIDTDKIKTATSFNSLGSNSARVRCPKCSWLPPKWEDFYDVVFCCFYFLNDTCFSAREAELGAIRFFLRPSGSAWTTQTRAPSAAETSLQRDVNVYSPCR